MTIYVIFSFNNIPIEKNFSIGLIESNIGDEWKVSYNKSTQSFYKTLKIKDEMPSTLYIESSIGEGNLYLELSQDGISEKIDITDNKDTMEIDISKYKDGKLEMKLFGDNSKNVKFKAYWN